MKLIAAKVKYTDDDLSVKEEIKYGYESIAQIRGDAMSLVFVVPNEHSAEIEDRSTLTSEIYCMPICYRNYELLQNMPEIDFKPKKTFKSLSLSVEMKGR